MMPISVGAASGVAPAAQDPAVAQAAARARAQVAAARQALASANSAVDQDKRNHSPGCVACDQKLVDKAQIQLAQAQSSVQAVGGTLDITA